MFLVCKVSRAEHGAACPPVTRLKLRSDWESLQARWGSKTTSLSPGACAANQHISPHGGWMLQCPGAEFCTPLSLKDPVCLPNPESFHSGFIWHVFCSSDWVFLRILAARWSWGSANPSCVNSPKWRPFFLLKIRRRALSLSFSVALKLVGGLQGVRGPPLPRLLHAPCPLW